MAPAARVVSGVPTSIMYQLVPSPRMSTAPMKAAQSPRIPISDRDALLQLVQADVDGCEGAMGQHEAMSHRARGWATPSVVLRGSVTLGSACRRARLLGGSAAALRRVRRCRCRWARWRVAARRCRRPCAAPARRASALRASGRTSGSRCVRWAASAPRSAPSARMAAMRCCSATCTGMRLQAGDGRDVHVGMRDRHERMPDRRREMAAGGAATPSAGCRRCRARRAPTYLPVKPTNQTSLGPVDWCRSCRRRW